MKLLIVGLGGFLGSAGRYLVGGVSQRFFSDNIIAATLIVNTVGSFLIGALAAFLLKGMLSDNLKLFLMTGVLGGFTTFSAFSLENLTLIQKGHTLAALTYAIASCVLGITAAWIGWKICS